jgi:hypothetical protein
MKRTEESTYCVFSRGCLPVNRIILTVRMSCVLDCPDSVDGRGGNHTVLK